MAGITQNLYKKLPVPIQNWAISAYGYSWKRRRFGGIFSEELKGFKDRENHSPEQWYDCETAQLRKLLIHSFNTVPFYNEFFKKAGLSLEELSMFDRSAIDRLPMLEKNDLRVWGKTNGDVGARDLKHELDVIRPYLEILKLRMEDRLATEIAVHDGLLSAEFPAMMIQTLVENAIKHGLEPKPEGGRLSVSAEIVHGKLAVTVADTGVGFGKAATAGTGVGLTNIRERLQLLYGGKGALAVSENPGGGTRVTVTVPYRTVEETSA